jgi:hypothetical protein
MDVDPPVEVNMITPYLNGRIGDEARHGVGVSYAPGSQA